MLKSVYRRIVPAEIRHNLYRLTHPEEYRHLRRAVYPSPRGDFSLRPFDEHRCIFIHIPKTAGISVAESLFGYLPYHYTSRDYRRIYGHSTYWEYFKFAFVRNPWDRLFSAYRFLMVGGWNDDDRQWATENIIAFQGFSDFVEKWLTPQNAQSMIHFWPQWQFVCSRRLRIAIDYLGYLETIEEDFSHVCRRLGIEAQLEHRNASARADYREHFTDRARSVVERVYREDIELFGYGFDGIERRRVISVDHRGRPRVE
jgi:hypothetical protein